MLTIKNIHAKSQDGKQILNGINLEVKPGQIHAIMGQNGAGKSTLAKVLCGIGNYEVTEGELNFKNEKINDTPPETRARMGMFLAFQYPVEIPGVSTINFIKSSLNEIRKFRNEKPMDAMEFMEYARKKCSELKIPEDFIKRPLNTGFSGGEKKKNEILQMALLEPDLMILDETDSGLDIDALKIVAQGVNFMRSKKRAIIIVTHYIKLLDYIEPDFVHVMRDGKIIKSGNKNLAHEIEKSGFTNFS